MKKYKAWDKIKRFDQIVKMESERKEFNQSFVLGNVENIIFEALDISTASMGVAYIYCRDNGLNFDEMLEKHRIKDCSRGYIENPECSECKVENCGFRNK